MNGTGNKYVTTGKNKPADAWMHFIYGKEKALSDNSEIKYKEETKNKNGGVSAQFPCYICTRTDKEEENYN